MIIYLLKIHDIVTTKSASYSCGRCPKKCNRSDTVLRHLREFHNSTKPKKCLFCIIVFGNLSDVQDHVTERHDKRINVFGLISSQLKLTTKQHVIKNFFQSYRMKFQDQLDLFAIMEVYKNDIQTFTKSKIYEPGPIKLHFSVFAKLLKPIDEIQASCHASSNAKALITELDDIEYNSMVDQMVSKLQIFCSSGRGFIVSSLDHLDISINLHKLIKGSSYVPTSAVFESNNFLLNIQNKNDNMCFVYPILAAIKPSSSHKKHDPVLYKNQKHQLDLQHFDFLMPIASISKTEANNNLAVNVFEFVKTSYLHCFYRSNLRRGSIC